MVRTLLVLPALLLILCSQRCMASDLEIIGSGMPGTTVTVVYEDQHFPNSVVHLGISLGASGTLIGPVSLVLSNPIAIVLMGITDANGRVAITVDIPATGIPSSYLGITFHYQAVAFDGMQFSVSNHRSFSFPML